MEPTYIALDLETTGLEPGRDEIIEIGAVKFRGTEVLETYQTLVKPRQVLPVKISRLTGIAASELVDAPAFNAIGADLVRFLKSYPIVGHSIGGDLRFLAAQNLRINQPSYDTFDLATLLVPQLPSYSLSSLAAHLQIPHPDAHRALADADVSRQVFIGLLDKMAALSAGELHEIAEMTNKLNWPTAKLFGEMAKKRVKTLWQEPISFKPKPVERPPALEPTGDVTPLDVGAVGAFFGPDGTLSHYFAGYEPRQEQAEMAQAVTAALNDGDTLMVEAGTGTGKCLVGDTWITFQSGRRQQIAAICHAEAPPTEPIVSVTPEGKLIYQQIQATYCNGIRPVFRVRTALGRTVTATANHPLLRFDGWQNLSDLQVGDRIATARCLPSGNEADLFDQAYLVGAMLGDGSCTNPIAPMFTNFDLEVVNEVRQDVATLKNVEMTSTQQIGQYGFRRLSLMGHERNGLCVLLEELGILRKSAHHKSIPIAFFMTDIPTLSRLLAGLWDTDGCVEKRDGRMSIASVSEQMIREIQHLLLRLNVVSRLRAKITRSNGKSFDSWELVISDLESKRNFQLTVGQFLVGPKKHRIEARFEQYQLQKHNPNDDLLPVLVWETVDHERVQGGKSWNSIRNNCVIASDRTRELSRGKALAIGEFLDSADLVDLATSDLYWDRIVAIEPAGEAETFDLTIDGEPNFIANDLVVHNSMAYLVPAAEFSRQRGERVVISTNTINLQDQLCSKDIPALQAILDTQEPDLPPLRAVQLKGRGNYLCLKRYEDVRAHKDHTDDETRALVKIQLWLPSTTTGDRSELMLMQNENSAWGSVNVNPDMCLRQRCPLYDQCFFYKARAEAENAHIVVVNHALLLSDVKSPGILPRYDHLIIDEAHNLEDVATDQLGFAIAQSECMAILDDLHLTGGPRLVQGLLAEWPVQFKLSTVQPRDRQRLEDLSDGLRPNVERGREAAQALFLGFNATMQHDRSGSQYDTRLRLTAKTRKQADWAQVEQAWENLSFNLRALADGLEKFQALLETLENRDIADYDGLLMRVKGLAKICQNVQQQLDIVVYGNEETVAWLTADQRRNELIVQAAPINVGPLLIDELWSKKRAVVLASATLSVNRSFAYPKARLGLDEATELQLDSPFDYAKSTLLYLPTDMPEPNEKSYQRALEDALISLCRATGGRTLALFTANHALRQTYNGISEALEKDEITTLAQGLDGSRRSLIQRFKSDPRTVLLGTSSFWEGVDVVGDALSVLVITKLPFSVPNDPVFSARSEGFDDAFGEYSVPQAILRFKQGFGRLIRSKEDRGIVLVLDRRLLSKGYGRTFINSLPECTVEKKPLANLAATAARWLV